MTDKMIKRILALSPTRRSLFSSRLSRSQAARRDSQAEDKRLVAYVVPRANPGPGASELRGFLKEKLPVYMLPAAFLTIDSIPLSSSGKIDRAALPQADWRHQESDVPFLPPRNDLELKIAEVWQQVLEVPKVGVNDNFFDLGGHSLLLIQMHGRVRDMLNVEFSLVDLFKYPTVAALAEFIGALAKPDKHQPAQESAIAKTTEGRNRLKQRLGRTVQNNLDAESANE
jgi:acyl carrier protein